MPKPTWRTTSRRWRSRRGWARASCWCTAPTRSRAAPGRKRSAGFATWRRAIRLNAEPRADALGRGLDRGEGDGASRRPSRQMPRCWSIRSISSAPRTGFGELNGAALQLSAVLRRAARAADRHAGDHPPGARDRAVPGEGGLDLRGLLAALPDDLPMSLEVPRARRADAARARAAALWRRPAKYFLAPDSLAPSGADSPAKRKSEPSTYVGSCWLYAVIGRDNIDGRYVGFRSRNSSARKQSRDGINRYVQGPS